MITTPGSLHENFERDNYWARIYFESDDRSKKSVVLVCASLEYFWSLFGAGKPDKDKLDKWYQSVIEKWKRLGDSIFKEEVHYDSYATTDEVKMKIREFLKNEVKPE